MWRKAKLLRWESLKTSIFVLWNCGYDGLFSYHNLLQYNLWISLYLLFVANSEAVLIQNHPLILFDWWSSTILIEWAHYPYLVTNTQILKNNKKVKIGLETPNHVCLVLDDIFTTPKCKPFVKMNKSGIKNDRHCLTEISLMFPVFIWSKITIQTMLQLVDLCRGELMKPLLSEITSNRWEVNATNLCPMI